MSTLKISTKGLLEFLVLKLLAYEGCNSLILRDRLEKVDFPIAEGTLSPILSEMRRQKLILYGWNEDFDPPIKCYDITEKGHHRLYELGEEWKRLNSIVRQVSKAH